MRALLWFKNAVVALGLSDLFGLVEFCGSCGRRVELVWWAHQELWGEITGKREGGCRCARCFDSEARSLGVMVVWHPLAAHRRDAQGRWSTVAPPDPEFYPVAARLHAERGVA